MAVPIIVAALVVVFVLGVGAAMTNVGTWYRTLRKPAWNSADWVFGPVWTIILSLAACSGVLAWINSSDTEMQLRIIVLFGVNIILYMLWSPLFFNSPATGLGTNRGGVPMAFDRGTDGRIGTGVAGRKFDACAVSALGGVRGDPQSCHSPNEFAVWVQNLEALSDARCTAQMGR